MNDCAGEVVVNMGKYYRKAYKRGVALKLFETKKGAAAKKAEKKGDEDKKPVVVLDDRTDIPPEEKVEEEVKDGQEVRIIEGGLSLRQNISESVSYFTCVFLPLRLG